MLLIGIGNAVRGDDGAGLAVARRLRAQAIPGLTVVESQGEPAALVERWRATGAVWVVDTVCSGAAPGTVHRFAAHHGRLPSRLFRRASTHALGLAEAVELARALHGMPRRLIIYGIEGHDFSYGAACSPEVACAVDRVVERLAAEIGRAVPAGTARSSNACMNTR